MKKLILPTLALAVLTLVACTPKAEGGETPAGTTGGEAAKLTYAADIQPIMTKNCISCHSGERPKEDLDLTSFANLSKGAHGNPIYTAGKSDDSLLYKVVTGNGADLMPPTGKMTDDEIAKIKAWIDGGAAE